MDNEGFNWKDSLLEGTLSAADRPGLRPKVLLTIVKHRYEALDAKGKELVGPAVEQAVKVLSDWDKSGAMDVKASESAANDLLLAQNFAALMGHEKAWSAA